MYVHTRSIKSLERVVAKTQQLRQASVIVSIAISQIVSQVRKPPGCAGATVEV